MGTRLLSPCQEDPEAVQGAMDRMAGSGHPQDRVVEGGGRETTASRQVDADAVAHHRPDRWTDGNTVSRTVSEAVG